MHAMPLLLGILCLMALAYRYYSAFLAAKVAVLDDARVTPAHRLRDGHNFEPTHKWVLFGHHFAAISGAGPLVGPVLAAQFGYLPGLLWIVIGVCLGGAVQDFLVLAASMRRDGRSLARIAYGEIGNTAGTAATVAILFIIVIALAGLGKVVVTALGGDEVHYPAGSALVLPGAVPQAKAAEGQTYIYEVPAGTTLVFDHGRRRMGLEDSFDLRTPVKLAAGADRQVPLPDKAVRLVPGSIWGMFTIACTIPIALFIGLYMYKLRPGKIFEASLIGAALTLAATAAGAWVTPTALGRALNLSSGQVTWTMAVYGFVASVLPVWVLLCPRDYLSSFLKIGTIGLLVVGTLVANPTLKAPAINNVFGATGPVVRGQLFPFLFITIMCGAISGFHALVSSGTTSKMIDKEGQARVIGYGAMLIEGLVAVVAMIAAATLPVGDYYAMNTKLGDVPAYQDKFVQIGANVDHLNIEERRTQEVLRGRSSGAVTLAVGMERVLGEAAGRFVSPGALEHLWKYWYHFAIMFEALFILTTIDAGTRIGRFLLQEIAGKVSAPLGRPDWWPGAIVSTLLIVGAWAYFITANSMSVIWPMFGVANQMLAVIALAVVSVVLVREGRGRYLLVTAVPLIVVCITTSTAAAEMLANIVQTISVSMAQPRLSGEQVSALIGTATRGGLIVAMLVCAYCVVVASALKIWPIWTVRGFSAAQTGTGRI